ncbi:MAG: hypothetical protein NZ902_06175 [Acidilobaceae archaeon]|nr:hypothetical protein [Acidilobaceae archaeon]MDW7974842.1 hypothetical protein [Sulfolobales archaeon]
MKREVLLAGVLVLATIAVALLGQATVYSHRTITGNANIAQQAVVRFEPGSNAGRPDVGGIPIHVTIKEQGDVAGVSIRPTNQTNWYSDVLRIRNLDNGVRQVCVRVEGWGTLRPGDRAELFVFPSGVARTPSGFPSPNFTSGFLARFSLLSPNSGCFNVASGAAVEIDIIVYIGDDGVRRGYTFAILRLESKR